MGAQHNEHRRLMRARYDDCLEDADIHRYIRWATGPTAHCQKLHAKFDGLVFHVSDPTLKNFIPPLDAGCRCRIAPASYGERNSVNPVSAAETF